MLKRKPRDVRTPSNAKIPIPSAGDFSGQGGARAERVKTDKRGKHSKFNPEYADIVTRLCLLGETNRGLAIAFGVAVPTIENWLKREPVFKRAVDEGRTHADAQIAQALFHRARGYSHPDTHVSAYQGEVILTGITKHYPPDTQAASFWLRNRRRDLWKTDAELAKIEPEDAMDALPVDVSIEFKDARRTPVENEKQVEE